MPKTLVRLFSLALGLILPHVLATEVPPTSFAYVLQADELGQTPAVVADKLNKAQRDWFILDPHFSEEVRWQSSDFKIIRGNNPNCKIIAYISIGEAENYRPYWKKSWSDNGKSTAVKPLWLLNENPEWKGNFVVKYWDKEWQEIILNSVKEAMAAGFDGVYLDIVDGFETFEKVGNDYDEDRLNPETKQSYRRDMVDWVKRIVAQARASKSDAIVIPQNGSALLKQPDFLALISGIGIEDLYTNGNKKQPSNETKEVLSNLRLALQIKKPVLLIEYAQGAKLQFYTKSRAHEDGLIGLLTDRELKTLGTSFR
jgi:cysteinyl-tRNA synthetase